MLMTRKSKLIAYADGFFLMIVKDGKYNLMEEIVTRGENPNNVLSTKVNDLANKNKPLKFLTAKMETFQEWAEINYYYTCDLLIQDMKHHLNKFEALSLVDQLAALKLLKGLDREIVARFLFKRMNSSKLKKSISKV